MNTQGRTKEYNLSTLADATFGGYVVGSSNNSYYMIADETNNDCALIKETFSGTEVWAKLYTQGRCTALAVDSTETYAYFTDYDDSLNALGLTQVNCSDGSTNGYFTTTSLEIDNFLLNIQISDTGNTLYMTGNLESTSTGNYFLCKWTLSGNNLDCSEWGTRPIDGLGLYSNSDSWVFTVVRDSGTVYRPTLINITSSSVAWSDTLSVSPSTLTAINAFIDYDGARLHVALPFPADGFGLFVILEQSDGSLINSLKQVSSSNTLNLVSLNVDSDTITWINSCVTSDPFNCELIRYDGSTDTFTNYQTEGAYFFKRVVMNGYFQGPHANAAVSESMVTNMDLFDSTFSTSTTSGFSNANSSFSITSGSYTLNSFSTSITWSISSTNTASTLSYTRITTVYKRKSDDGLSDGEIAGIVIGSIAGVVIIGLVVLLAIFICYKKQLLCFKGDPKTESKPITVATSGQGRIVS